MSDKIELDGILSKDTMHLMNGDNPAVEYEAGNQIGGHYACAGCDAHMNMVHDYQYTKYIKHQSLEEEI
jgi:hypothetical protein